MLYKCFTVDLKLVGISYLGAFLISSCVMMPIMSVVQRSGCDPSCIHVRITENLLNCMLSVVIFCLPRHLSVFVCGVLALQSFQVGCLSHLVWLFLSSDLFSFPLLLSAIRAKTSGEMMALRKEPVNACPTCQAKYLSFGVPPKPPPLTPPLPPDP